MRYHPVQKLYKDTKRNLFFLEQDIWFKHLNGINYQHDGHTYICYYCDIKKVGDSMEHTECADKYSNFELKIIERTYRGLGLRYFLAREMWNNPTANVKQLEKEFYDMIEKDQP